MTNIQTVTRTNSGDNTMIKRVLKFIWNIVKHVFLLPMYCSMPDKYSGKTYSEWLNNDKK